MPNPILEAVEGAFKGIIKPILDKWIPDAQERVLAEQLLFKASQDVSLAQIEVNKIEAGSQSIFVAGWRPAIGWICGATYGYTFILQPFLTFSLAALGSPVDPTQLPVIDMSELSFVLMGMLGLGAMRSYEKVNKA